MADRIGAVIAAAGKADRMGETDKVFALIAGKPLLAWVVEAFEACPLVNDIVIVLNEKNIEQGRTLVDERGYSKVTELCVGGPRRQDSVARGLEQLRWCTWVIIHDGARPCVSRTLIERGLKEARGSGAAIAAVPVTDTVKRVGVDMVVEETPSRESLWVAQTPQVFRWDMITRAYREVVKADVTDDAALLEAIGHKVKVYMGSYDNIKVTTPQDLALAELILTQSGRLGR